MILKRFCGWVGLVAFAALGSCGGKSWSSGSNSNWVCASDTDCIGNGQALYCMGGYCHTAAEASSGNSAGGASTGATSAGGASSTSTEAISSSTTGGIGPGGGAGPSSDAGSNFQAPSCDAQSATISSFVSGAVDSADTTCTTDADCTATTFDMGPTCAARCGGAVVSISGLAKLENDFDYIDRTLCPTFAEGGCSIPAPIPCVSPAHVSCQDGHCARTTEPGASKLTCDQTYKLISDRISLIENAADIDCTFDSDCTSIPRAESCFALCQTRALSQTGAAEVQTVLDEIDKDICSQMADAPCNFPVTPCISPGTPVCEMGQCTFKQP